MDDKPTEETMPETKPDTEPEQELHKIENIEYQDLESKFKSMVEDPSLLKIGYSILEPFEAFNKFHLGMLQIIFNKNTDKLTRKLVCSTLKVFLKRNWNDERIISNTEKLVGLFINIFNHFHQIKGFPRNFDQ